MLTPQEMRVARAVADGLNNPEVAQRLYMSRKTVEAHPSRIYRKLGVAGRFGLIAHLTRDTPR
jgi:DNA-binding NarL/FixJ family response regulator